MRMTGVRRIVMTVVALTLVVTSTSVPFAAGPASPPPAAQIKQPAVAGGFYPADSGELAREIDSYIAQAQPVLQPGDRVVALVVPHAGIAFSGRVAAYSYKLLKEIHPKTVILVGPSHRVAFTGVSIYDRGYFRTPLGLIPVDTVLARQIAAGSPDIRFFPDAFAQEHNIEVQLPFLQRACPGVSIVPLVMGSQSAGEVILLKDILVRALRGRDAVLIASTDLSHYHPAEDAGRLDRVCAEDVRVLDGERLLRDLAAGKTEACGGGPAACVLLAARDLGADIGRVLKYGDSGDVGPKDKTAVVGYLAAALVDTGGTSTAKAQRPARGEVMTLTDAQEKRLLAVARESIEYYLANGKQKTFANTDSELAVPAGAFVTLKEQGELRGCIGQVEAVAPLLETVASCAISSAVHDPRFPPVTGVEVPKLKIEISVLTPAVAVAKVEDIVVGRDGLIIEKGFHRGLLLPQVPEEWGWNREQFLQNLCRKAGLGPDEWKSGAKIYSFQALVFGEE